MVQIRRATRADREVVYAFHRALYVEHRQQVLEPSLQLLYAYRDFDALLGSDVDSLLQGARSSVWLAEESDQVLGYVTGRIEFERERVLPCRGVVEDWYVLQSARGRGVGRLLLEHLLQFFADSGCDLAESSTLPANAPARRLHEALGFRETEIKYRRLLEPRRRSDDRSEAK